MNEEGDEFQGGAGGDRVSASERKVSVRKQRIGFSEEEEDQGDKKLGQIDISAFFLRKAKGWRLNEIINL